MSLRKLFVWLAAFLLCSCELFSQRYPFINYTPLDGLINNRVRALYQDSKGRLYFLTFGGLSVYDGARFTNYSSADGLALDVVNDMLEITPDSFWVATNTNELNCLVKGKVKTLKTTDEFSPVINSFLKTKNGTIYVAADEGLFIWQNNRFNQLPVFYDGKDVGKYLVQVKEAGDFLVLLVNPSLSDDAGTVFLYDCKKRKIIFKEKEFKTFHITASPEDDIWLSSNKGVRVLRKENLRQGIFHDEDVPKAFESIGTKKATFIRFDNLGELWLSIYNEGLLFIKPGNAPVLYAEANGLA